MSKQRYIPPHARKGLSTQPNTSDLSQRALSDLQGPGSEVFMAVLKSAELHQDLPGLLPAEEAEPQQAAFLVPDTHKQAQQFAFTFEHQKLQHLLRWFRSMSTKDADATIAFSPTLNKGHRQQIHRLAQKLGLGTSSQGYGEKRYISIFSEEKAALGVGRIHLHPDEQQKADKIWELIQEEGGDLLKFSRNEVQEMILADRLEPALQKLFDNSKASLHQEFSEKCRLKKNYEKSSN